ncbi:DUF1835 domain-containing protein [Bacillus benzoevorans]|uniref:DUF1835 domain-containing protein n=1 Tax=Bacillus benzoevorans TaxID=1456 RepID=A0A7X0LU36_9BACI|nr:hypothetical protein [Bacillus benzoevorans]
MIKPGLHIVSSESAVGSLRVGLERLKVVTGLPESSSIGPLWKLDEEAGQRVQNEWLYEYINYEQMINTSGVIIKK